MEQTAAFNGTTTKDQQAWKTKKGFGPLIVVATLLLGLAFHAGQMSGSRTVAGRTRGGGAAADASLMSDKAVIFRSFNTRTDTYYSDDSPMVRVGSPAVQQQENQAFESKTSEHDCDKICCINQVCGPDLWETSCGANFRKTGCGNYVCLQIPTPGGGEDDDLVLNTCTQQGRVCSQNNIVSSVSSNGGYLSTDLLTCDTSTGYTAKGLVVAPPKKCGSCYGAGAEGECCNTCGAVQNAYDNKNWIAPNLANIVQCNAKQAKAMLD